MGLLAVLLAWDVYLTVQIANNEKLPETEPNVVSQSTVDYTTDVTEMLDNTRSTVVSVNAPSRSGSGFVYSHEENSIYLITSSDLYSDSSITVMFDSSAALPAEVVGVDEVTGVMMLKAEPPFEVKMPRLGDSSLLQQGEYVLTLSGRRPYTGSSVVSFGIVSEPGQLRLNASSSWYTTIVETDAVVTQDAIGGPLLDQGGSVVGMLVRNTGSSDRLNMAVGINEIRFVAEQLKETGTASRGSLGIVSRSVSGLRSYEKSSRGLQLDDITGVLVTDVYSDNGIRAGDVIQTIDGETVENNDDLCARLYAMHTGDTVELEILRNNEQTALSVVLE